MKLVVYGIRWVFSPAPDLLTAKLGWVKKVDLHIKPIFFMPDPFARCLDLPSYDGSNLVDLHVKPGRFTRKTRM